MPETNNREVENPTKSKLFKENLCKITDDIFNFKLKVGKVIDDILREEPPFVYAICGKWGSGKSSFLYMLIEEISKKIDDPVIIYFNAWKSSIHENPLMSFVYEVTSQLENDRRLSKKLKTKKNKEQLKTALKSMWNSGIKAASYILPQAQLINIFNESYKAISVSNIKNILKSETKLRDDFEKICNILSKKKIEPIVIIDDLDRCHPLQIVKIIEMLKMIFSDSDHLEASVLSLRKDNKNLVSNKYVAFKYIISIDENYLVKSISSKYGLTIKDSEEYVSKFIQFREHLYPYNWINFIKKIIEENNIDREKFFPEKSGGMNESLKDIEVIFLNFHVDVPRQAKQILSYLFTWQINNKLIYDVILNLYDEHYRELSRIYRGRFDNLQERKVKSKNEVQDLFTRALNVYLGSLACIKVLFPNEFDWVLRRNIIIKFPKVVGTRAKENTEETPKKFLGEYFGVIDSEIMENGKIRPEIEIIKVSLQSSLIHINKFFNFENPDIFHKLFEGHLSRLNL